MTVVTLSRRNVFALLIGFLIIVSIGAITSVISFYMVTKIYRASSINDLQSFQLQQPFLTVSWALRIVSFIAPIFAGLVVGRMIKEKGWLYGGLLGLFLSLISIVLVLITIAIQAAALKYAANQNTLQDLAIKNVTSQLISTPILILKTALGGFIGEKLVKNKK